MSVGTFSQRGEVIAEFAEPVVFVSMFWPEITLYKQQREILYSLRDNYETIVPAGNELGKDFIAGLAVLWFFISRTPCRIVTTSPNSGQLEDVLWGEIKRFIDSAEVELPIQYNHLKMRKLRDDGDFENNTECVGRVVQKGESLLGRHTPRTINNEPMTLLVVDEASGVEDKSYKAADTWTHRKLVISNCYPCTNFFFNGVQEGDKESDSPNHDLYRKVIKIQGIDSPNVRLAEAQKAKGQKVTHEEIIPGVLTYADYQERREVWSTIDQTIGLDAELYQGAEVLLFPPEWRSLSKQKYIEHLKLFKGEKRVALGIGIDPAEGGDNTSFTAVDRHGIIERVRLKTPDTTECVSQTIAFARKHKIQYWENVGFDRGGGGKQHADRMRKMGMPVRTIGFGERPSYVLKAGLKSIEKRKLEQEQTYVYKNRRAEMYHRFRLLLDPSENPDGFSIDPRYEDLQKQMAPIPLEFDQEGRIVLPPKNPPPGNKDHKGVTLIGLIGHSPDELDSAVIAVHMMQVKSSTVIIGGARAKRKTTGF